MERLYIIQGERGLFKAGRTSAFARRLLQHEYEFVRRGDEVTRHRTFEVDGDSRRAERLLLEGLAAHGYARDVGAEWFRDVDFDAAAALALQSAAGTAAWAIGAPDDVNDPRSRPVARALRQAIALAGTQGALAEEIGVTQQCISNWIRRPNSAIDAVFCMRIERHTGVSRALLRPDDFHEIWPDFVAPI
jgi:DNA-binding transcriptional regulator YdaS (Cro superfamily)